MSVTLTRAYGGYASGAKVIFADDTETALVSQGWATFNSIPAETVTSNSPTPYSPAVSAGNQAIVALAGQANPTNPNGARKLANANLTAFASMGTSAVHVAGTWYRGEIYVPFWATWTGMGILNGATVGTDNLLFALYDTAGNLVANSAVAGTLSAGANSFQEIAFTSTTPPLAPGRYFLAVQCNGTTATTRRKAAADGGLEMCSTTAGTFGTVPSSFTVPTTFTAAASPIGYLYQ